MTADALEIAPDAAMPEGSHAVIRLKGVWVLPSGATYRIEPLDDELEPADGWPAGERHPAGTRLGADGVELLIGPEIVDHASLLPGTPVVISVPAASVRSELLWPNLPIAPGPRRASIVLTADQCREATARARLGPDTDGDDSEEPGEDTLEARHSTETGSAASSAAPTVASPPVPPAAIPPAEAAASPSGEPQTDAPPEPLPRSSALVVPAVAAAPVHAGLTERRGHSTATAQAPRTTSVARTAAAFGAGGLAATIAMWIVLGPAPTTTLPRPAERSAQPALPMSKLLEALTPGPVSPRGIRSDAVDQPTALLFADQHLSGDGRPLDRDEAQYWLRRVVTDRLADLRPAWAVTKLGTLYAIPSHGAPDFAKAAALWEIAAAEGDPVARCFLASVAEHGLLGKPDRERALAELQRAKSDGGCPDIDQRIKALSR